MTPLPPSARPAAIHPSCAPAYFAPSPCCCRCWCRCSSPVYGQLRPQLMRAHAQPRPCPCPCHWSHLRCRCRCLCSRGGQLCPAPTLLIIMYIWFCHAAIRISPRRASTTCPLSQASLTSFLFSDKQIKLLFVNLAIR
jgi:hypothetical protein